MLTERNPWFQIEVESKSDFDIAYQMIASVEAGTFYFFTNEVGKKCFAPHRLKPMVIQLSELAVEIRGWWALSFLTMLRFGWYSLERVYNSSLGGMNNELFLFILSYSFFMVFKGLSYQKSSALNPRFIPSPSWPKLRGVAHSLRSQLMMGVGVRRFSSISIRW